VNGDQGPRGNLAQAELAGPAADLNIERVVGRLLIVGTYGSVAVLAVGTALMVAGGTQPLGQWPRFDPGRIGDDILHLRAAGFLWLGLVAVVATPAARIVASLIGYVRSGERLMAVIAVLILTVIALSVGLARGLEG
jgi:uncharacterized membrane protein